MDHSLSQEKERKWGEKYRQSSFACY